jgi:hypothetical protein
MRWITVLEGRGLITVSTSDTGGSGPVWIDLTKDGASKIKQLTDHWGAAFLSI